MLKNNYILLFFSFLSLYSCTDTVEKEKPKDKKYGGTFVVETGVAFGNKISKTEYLPYRIGESSYIQIFRSVFETLTIINPNTCELEPGLAKRWEVNNDATEYTFTIRDNVFFHKNKLSNEALNAQDVKNCFDELSNSTNTSVPYAKIKDIIEGVAEYNESVIKGNPLKEGVSGVRVINDSTVVFKLKKPYTTFLDVVSNLDFGIFKRDESNNQIIGTGPFYLDTVINDSLFLARHDNYWKFDKQNNRLPYLDALVYKRNTKYTIQERLSNFINNRTQLLRGIKADDISVVMKVLREENDVDFGYESTDDSRLCAISFNTMRPPFDDVNVRKAFSYAFDRNLYVDSVLNGEQWAANNGLMPLEVSQYPQKAKGLEFDLAKAKEYLAKAGYPNGKGFPVVELSVIGAEHEYGEKASQTEKVVLKMICDNLGIKYKFKEYRTFITMFRDLWAGKGMISIYNYTARYPSPESYLNVFNLKIDSSEHVEHDNTMFFRDSVFDSYYKQALSELDEEKRTNLFYKAENRVMDLAPLLPIYHGESNRIVSKNIAGLSEINNLGIVNFSEVYFIKE